MSTDFTKSGAAKLLLFFAVFIATAALMINFTATGFAPLSGAGSGLVAHYTFDEGSGTTSVDFSGQGNNATLVGSASWAAGKTGQALLVSGGSRATISGDRIGTGAATICAWINPSAVTYLHSIVSTTAFQLQAFNTGSGSSYSIYLLNNSAAWQNTAISAGGITPGQWAHVCAVRQSSGNTTLYVNGAQSGAANQFAGTPVNNYGGVPLTQTTIGADPNGSAAFTGSIDDVRIYNRELPANEVQELYNGAPAVPDTQAPSTPTGLNATAASQSQINLTWNPSSDNVIIIGYNVYRNGTHVGTATTTAYNDTGLAANTAYSYTVAAYDAAGNTSAQSSQASATTTSTPPATFTLTVAKSGTGSGTISGGAINCGTTCTQTAITTGTQITLTANPATGSTFTGWSGACTGTTNCTLTIGANTSTTATFNTTSGGGSGNTINVNCSGNITTALQNAINSASDGDTINIGAGSCSAGQVSWVNKNITVRGQGIGATNVSGLSFDVKNSTKSAFRITGMSVGAAPQWRINADNRTTGIKGWRLDHIEWSYPTCTQNIAVMIDGITWGLIDNSVFRNAGNAIFLRSYAEGTDEVSPWPPDGSPGMGGYSWLLPLNMGSDEAVYVEDSTFIMDNGCYYGVGDSFYGGKRVFRHNTVTNAYFQNHAARGHERGGSISSEVYNNVFDATDSGWYRPIHIRSGTGVVFNNTIKGFFNRIDVDDQRSCGENINSPFGACNGSSPWDGNQPGQSGYPCLDQIGRGTGQYPNQPLAPYYFWNNGSSATCSTGGSCNNSTSIGQSACSTSHIQEGRDYIIGTQKPGYSPYTYPHPLQGGVSPPSDTSAPTVPAGLGASQTTSSGTTISWNASTDNTGVTGYRVYRNSVQIGTATGTSYADTGLSPSTTYSYRISAYDAAGNTSAQSSALSVTTSAGTATFTLTVAKSGTGNGTVSGGTINCGTTCTQTATTGTQITLTANPATGSTFTGWSGACTGTTNCTLTINTNTSATATFNTTTPPPTGGLIPADRLNDWTYTGVPGGIPNRTTICATLNPGASASQINSAISSCNNGVVYLNAGTYNVTGIQLYKSNVTLRGAGADKTILKGGNIIAMGNGGNSASGISITGGTAKGSTAITVSNTSGLSAGMMIEIDRANDPGVVVSTTGNASRFIRQVNRIKSISGNTINLENPLFYNFNSSPTIRYTFPTFTSMSGVEDLKLDHSGSGSSGYAFYTNYCYGCWVKGVHSYNPYGFHMVILGTLNIEIRDSFFNDAQTVGANNAGLAVYGSDLYGSNSNMKIENNIFDKSFPGIELQNSTSGNYLGYNYGHATQVVPDDYFTTWMFLDNHGPHDMMNLWEGNTGELFGSDGYFGGSSHGVAFRNNFTGVNLRGPQNPDNPVRLNRLSYYYTLVGNVLGSPSARPVKYEQASDGCGDGLAVYRLGYPNIGNCGLTDVTGNNVPGGMSYPDAKVKSTLFRWGNYDYFNNAARWDSSEIPAGVAVPATQALPDSLIYSSRPSWWPSAVAWPPIGPDVAAKANKIPAQLCFENNNIANGGAFNAASCYGSTTSPTCTSFTYSAWGACIGGMQTRTVLSSLPSGCTGGSPITSQACTVANNPPTVSITSPANNTTLSSPSSVTITASASDSDGAINKVEFFNAATLIATTTTPPYTTTLNNPTAGTYTLTAKATDNQSATTTSTPITLTITQDTTPPIRSNGEPTGTLPSTITQTNISLNTNEPANCRYTTIANTTYNNMGLTLTPNTPISTTHTTNITGIQPSRTYTYYIRCTDNAGNANTNDYTITFTTAAPSPINGSCGPTNNTCTQGTLNDVTDSATNYLWNCNGTNGGTNASCSIPKPVNGACGTTLNSCTQGTLNDTADNATQYLWNCNGTNGGTVASCSLTKPINGTCGTAAKAYAPTENFPNGNYCNTGTPNPTTPTNPTTTTPSNWTCTGTNGGTNSPTCTATRTATPINGTCSNTPETCTTGTYTDATDTPTQYNWNCNGINGGTNATCTQPKPPPTVQDGTTLDVILDTPQQFTLATPGTYKLTGTVIAPDGGQNSVYIDIDTNPGTGAGTGDETKAWGMTITTTPQQQDATWQGNPKTWTLTTGTHTLYINTRETGTQITTIRFTNLQPVNGICSTTLNTCNNGTFQDATDTATTYNWNCNGTNGGTNATCSTPKPPTATDADADGVSDAVDRCPTPPLAANQINSYGCPIPTATKFDIKPDFTNMDLNNVTNLEIGISTYGKITYTNTHLTLANIQNGLYHPANLDNDINITRGLITVNANNIPALNQPVAITLYNINVTNPKIKRNGTICTECQIISNTNGTLVFTVPGF